MFKLNNSRRYNIQLHLRTSLVDFTRKEWKEKEKKKGEVMETETPFVLEALQGQELHFPSHLTRLQSD